MSNEKEILRKGDTYLAENLSLMLETVLTVIESNKISKDTLNAAEDCVCSLLKSIAIVGREDIDV